MNAFPTVKPESNHLGVGFSKHDSKTYNPIIYVMTLHRARPGVEGAFPYQYNRSFDALRSRGHDIGGKYKNAPAVAGAFFCD